MVQASKLDKGIYTLGNGYAFLSQVWNTSKVSDFDTWPRVSNENILNKQFIMKKDICGLALNGTASEIN